ncbi:MAG: hypothetical protein J6A20_10685 [Muribaculaceae bacterium]|nr:hypothetical protein [Muribaculaceae bacterium]
MRGVNGRVREGYSVVNIKSFRKFYLTFSNLLIGQTVSAQLELAKMLPSNLSWSHYERLMRVKNEDERDWYVRDLWLKFSCGG